MAKYGFDENEVISTKTIQIDKDGFCKVTDGEGSGGFSSDAAVTFIDIDGTVLREYTRDEFINGEVNIDYPTEDKGCTRMGDWNMDITEAIGYLMAVPNAKMIMVPICTYR